MPLLALMTGARAGELVPLERSDICEADGITYLSLRDDPEAGRTLKNENSRRRVPVHPLLIDIGFLDFVAACKGRLFPDLRPDANGKFSGLYSKSFMYWLRNTVRITDARKVFHSFRHTFKDACRDAGIPEDVHDALTGHAGATVGRGYGSGPSLATLNKAVASVRFPVDLTHLIK